MGKKGKNRWMVTLCLSDGSWEPVWPAGMDERTKGRMGLKKPVAERWFAELVAPVTGYEHLPDKSKIRGHGVDPDLVRIEPFVRGAWKKEEKDAAE